MPIMKTPQQPVPVKTKLQRRAFLGTLATGIGALGMWPDMQILAADVKDFLVGPPMKDIPATQISKHVWLIYSPDGFPTLENRGMMSNVTFVVTSAGVVIIDSGSSLQIGQMAIRMRRSRHPSPPHHLLHIRQLQSRLRCAPSRAPPSGGG